MSLIYKYSQLSDQITYQESLSLVHNKLQLHLGQLKLFFTELLFLTKYANKGDKVIYVGAAEGYHITKLSDLFPDLTFDLWDPRKFDTEPRKNIKIYNEFFTDDSARAYKNIDETILFICDIRNLKIGEYKRKKQIDKMDDLVIEDMEAQKKWVQIINPKQAYLKFRLPYEFGPIKYLSGTIYLQPYSKFSTETRILTNNYEEMITYDIDEFNNRMAYFNACIRYASIIYTKWITILKKYNLLNCWDNIYSIHLISYYLRKVKNINSDEETGKLFMEIVDYHIKKYGKKYDVIFNKI